MNVVTAVTDASNSKTIHYKINAIPLTMLLVNDRAWNIRDVKKPADQDFYSVMEPVSRYCRIAGIFPFTLKGPVGNRKYITSPVAVIYSLFVIFVTVADLLIWTEYENLEMNKQAKYNVILISVHFELALTIVLTTVIYISVVFRRKEFSNAMDDLSSQDEPLRRLGCRINYAADYKRYYVRFGSIVLLIVILCTYDFAYQFEFNMSHPFNWLAWTYPNLMRVFGTCFFTDILIALRQRFVALNDQVRKMIRERKDLPPEIISKQYRICTRLRSVATVHGILCETALTVNEIFAVSIVVEIIQVLISLTTTMYHIFHEIKMTDKNYVIIFGWINWGVISVIHVIYIIVICCMTKNQATLTGKLIHKLNAHEIDTPLNTVIQSFSLQLQHEKIEFSGAGLFPLDATLIQSIVGAVTTYLVILIQFDTTAHQTTISQLEKKHL